MFLVESSPSYPRLTVSRARFPMVAHVSLPARFIIPVFAGRHKTSVPLSIETPVTELRNLICSFMCHLIFSHHMLFKRIQCFNPSTRKPYLLVEHLLDLYCLKATKHEQPHPNLCISISVSNDKP